VKILVSRTNASLVGGSFFLLLFHPCVYSGANALVPQNEKHPIRSDLRLFLLQSPKKDYLLREKNIFREVKILFSQRKCIPGREMRSANFSLPNECILGRRVLFSFAISSLCLFWSECISSPKWKNPIRSDLRLFLLQSHEKDYILREKNIFREVKILFSRRKCIPGREMIFFSFAFLSLCLFWSGCILVRQTIFSLCLFRTKCILLGYGIEFPSTPPPRTIRTRCLRQSTPGQSGRLSRFYPDNFPHIHLKRNSSSCKG
jgi:hypothetical protein